MFNSSATKKGIKFFAILFLVLSLLSACYATVFGAPSEDPEVQKFKDAKLAIEVMYLMRNEYYKPVAFTSLFSNYFSSGTISGMLSGVLGTSDPYTHYMDKEQYDQMKNDNAGVFGGIGINIGERFGAVTVLSPLEGTPAMRAGLITGDKIVSVDGTPTLGTSTTYVSSLLKGEPGTKVLVEIDRYGEKFTVEITREIINSPATRYYMFDDVNKIGYICLTSFTQRSAADVETALNSLKDQGMKSLVLDLRFNGGGLVDQAIAIASKFIPAGPVMFVQPRDGSTIVHNTNSPREVYVPVVVLVNQYTASASEILSGAMQDTKSATIVGMPTFGKGLVQTVYPLSDDSGLSLTTQIYLTAGQRAITHDTPIVPDVKIEMEEYTEEMDLARKAKNDAEIANGKKPTADDMMRIDIEYDIQMKTAVDILMDLMYPKLNKAS